MKVVHIHFGKDGGSERFFVTLLNGLHECGVEQKIFIRPNRVWRREIEHCGEIFEGTFNRISLYRFVLSARLKRVVREFEPDAVMAWAPRASGLLPRGLPCLTISRLGDYPLRLDYYGNTDVIVGNMPGIVERVRDLGWTRRTEVISNFTRFGKTEPARRADFGTPEGAFLIAAMGRFVPRKGFHTLLDAVARLPDAWLWLMGEGEQRDNLERQARDLGIENRIRFLGWHHDTAPFVAAADAFVMPSSHEPLGNVILEAWSLKRPVVSSRAEGPTFMMTNGEDGLLVDAGDADGFAAALGRLRESAALREALVRGGTQTLETRFSQKAITDLYMRLFASGKP
jgi:glycosyltransferase involved in cell wall biosynthesis